ncbi:MAG: arginine repressor [Lachnospiraceae bacterium]|nr:arginine repressor [Lachnospiraceae bacterium]
MKNKRHEEILKIINEKNVETQEELCLLLRRAGYDITQATVSRDIKQLNLIKTKSGQSGKQKYIQEKVQKTELSDKLVRVLQDSIVSMEDAQNILVIKTVSGMAMAAAAAIDSLNIKEIVGSIAGDDTIMCVVKDVKQMKFVMDTIGGICYKAYT